MTPQQLQQLWIVIIVCLTVLGMCMGCLVFTAWTSAHP